MRASLLRYQLLQFKTSFLSLFLTNLLYIATICLENTLTSVYKCYQSLICP